MCRQDPVLRGMLLVICVISSSGRAVAQQTREEQLALGQTEKCRNLHPYDRSCGWG